MRIVIAAAAAMVLAFGAAAHGALVANGDFEGGSYATGDDTVPNQWGTWETQWGGGETSVISLVSDNGPSGAGGDTWSTNFSRPNGGGSGDYTVITQALDIDTSDYTSLRLDLDVKALSHDLCGGGSAGGWEYPIEAVVKYKDSSDVAKRAHLGFYLQTSPGCDATANWTWWGSTGTWARSKQVVANTWYAESMDLLNPTLDIAHITELQIGGSGHSFEGRADNVAIVGIPVPEPGSVALLALGALGLALRRP